MRNKLRYLAAGVILAVLSPLAAASMEGITVSDKRFWQGPDTRKIEERVERRSQQALNELEKQRQPHADQFGRVDGGSRSSAGDSAGSGGSSAGK